MIAKYECRVFYPAAARMSLPTFSTYPGQQGAAQSTAPLTSFQPAMQQTNLTNKVF